MTQDNFVKDQTFNYGGKCNKNKMDNTVKE